MYCKMGLGSPVIVLGISWNQSSGSSGALWSDKLYARLLLVSVCDGDEVTCIIGMHLRMTSLTFEIAVVEIASKARS